MASDEQLEAWIRAECQHTYHAACTCRMGAEDDGVLDPELRVRGVDGLRVVDASSLPTITSGNTNAPVIMVAERAADLILGRPLVPAEDPGGSARARRRLIFGPLYRAAPMASARMAMPRRIAGSGVAP